MEFSQMIVIIVLSDSRLRLACISGTFYRQ